MERAFIFLTDLQGPEENAPESPAATLQYSAYHSTPSHYNHIQYANVSRGGDQKLRRKPVIMYSCVSKAR